MAPSNNGFNGQFLAFCAYDVVLGALCSRDGCMSHAFYYFII